jgi:hypothetical protein
MENWTTYQRQEFEDFLADKASLLYARDVRVHIRREGAVRLNEERQKVLVKIHDADDIARAAEELAEKLSTLTVVIDECQPRKYGFEYGKEIYGRYVDEILSHALRLGDQTKTYCRSLSDYNLRARYLGIWDAPEDIRSLFRGADM